MKRILILSLHFPVTIARYFENAFRRRGDVEVVTVGPYTGNWIPWKGGIHLKESYANPPTFSIPTAIMNTGLVPMEFANTLVGGFDNYDMILTIDAGIKWTRKPSTKSPVVHIATDPHVLDYDLPRSYSDYFFNMQEVYSKPGDIYLPYAFDPGVHYKMEDVEKIYDAALIGLQYPNRISLVSTLRSKGYTIYFETGDAFDEYRLINNQSRIGISWSSKDDLIARVFEMMGMGLIPIINRVPDLPKLFQEDIHYFGFSNLEEAIEKFDFAMSQKSYDRKVCDNIAKQAYDLVWSRDTYDKRVQTIMDLVFPRTTDTIMRELGYTV